MLCTACSLALLDIEHGERHVHHETFADVKRAADASCKPCFSFWDSLSEHEKIDLLESDRNPPQDAPDHRKSAVYHMIFGPDQFHDMPDDSLEMWLSTSRSSFYHSTGGLTVFRLTPADDNDLNATPKFAASPSTNSENTWTLIRTWIRECTEEHRECNSTDGSSWYPARLVGIDHDKQTLRLIETSRQSISGHYATVSYRWHESSNFVLDATSQETMERGFPIMQMPQAFQDAVTVCRRINIDKIWIDALCIRQDTGELGDWRVQSLLMDKIYSNALLNISTEAAENANNTFFVERDPALISIPIVRASRRGSVDRRYYIESSAFWVDEIVNASLNRRAWVVQERLLARRVLHFGRNQVTWECRERKAAESYPSGCTEVVISDSTSKDRFAALSRLTCDSAYDLWHAILSDYSKCSLSKPTDKLVALAGVAKQLSKLMGSPTDYVAGMWRPNLETDMLWLVNMYTHGPKRPPRRYSEYTAPSWSWASLNADVLYMARRPGKPLWKVLDISLNLASNDPMGALSEGSSLLLQCPLAKIAVSDKRSYEPWAEVREIQVPSQHDVKISMDLYWDEDDQVFDPTGQELFCAAARIQQGYETEEQDDLKCLFLRLVDRKTATYARCGLASPRDKEDLKVLQAAFESGEELPCPRLGAECIIRLI